MTRAAAAALALSIAAGAAGAEAQTPLRAFGVGTTLGLAHNRNNLGNENTSFFVGTLSLHLPLSPRVEVEVWSPLLNLAFSFRRWWWVNAFVRWYPLRPSSGLFVAAGAGYMTYAHEQNAATVVQLPARVGWEFSSDGRGSSVRLGVRPWVDLVIPRNDLALGSRLGVMAEIEFTGYFTR